ncbi:MAG: hypothetical protein ACI87N_001349 [Flavobacteriales bacterium]|jgi:hypothetical protein
MFQSCISRHTPAYFLFIIDQSARMKEPYADGLTKGQYVARQVNELINDLINLNMAGDNVQDRFFISIIGHSNGRVIELRSGYLSSFADNPLRVQIEKKKVSNGVGGLIEIEWTVPIFIEPLAKGLEDELAAFQFSKEIIERWMKRKNYLSTAMINISGGYPKDWKEITCIVNDIKNIAHSEDKVILCNMLIDRNIKLLEYPTHEEVFNQSFSTQMYFEWSTYINQYFLPYYNKRRIALTAYKKMFVNQNLITILNFIDNGS